MPCREVASRLDRELRPHENGDALLAGLDERSLRELGYQLPEPGQMPRNVAERLVEILAQHTTSPHECYFAVWDGWAALSPSEGFGPAFEIPSRPMTLYSADIHAASERFDSTAVAVSYSPNLWWPADRAWCVATEIDFTSTYIGSSSAAALELITSELDAFEMQPDEPPRG